MSRPYLCVSIDTECDRGPAWRSQPLSFRGVHEGIVDRLQPMFASFGAKATYLVSSEVLGDARSIEALRGVSASCELGTRHGDGQGPTNDETAKGRLRSLTDQFIRAFEFQPLSFRTDAASLGRRTIGLLEDLGYGVESSVTPNVASSAELSFLRAPTQPYKADLEDPTQRGDSKIVEVPITIRRRRWSRLPGIGRYLPPEWLRPTWTREETLVRLVQDEIADARRDGPERPVILHAMLHATEVVPAASPYASFESDARRILDRLRTLLRFAQRESIAVVGLGDVPEILQT